jgi:YesN/AraC family two-component response regulator
MPRILLADDHELIRKGLRALLEAKKESLICGEAGDGQEAVERVVELQPDLIILDVTMPALNGLQAAQRIREQVPKTKILILSMHDSPSLRTKPSVWGLMRISSSQVLKLYCWRRLQPC